jgi:hypothetical protein
MEKARSLLKLNGLKGGRPLGSRPDIVSKVSLPSRPEADVEPDASQLEQKRSEVAWARRRMGVEIPVVKLRSCLHF